MKKLFGLLTFIVLIAVGAVVMLPKFVSMEKVERQLKEKVQAVTGRNIDFSGAQFVFWPNIGVEIKDVTIDNPSWAKNKNMLEAKAVAISLAVQPLFQKKIEIKKFSLESPTVSVETGPDGSSNLSFSAGASQEKAPAQSSETGVGSGVPADFQLKLGESQITNGTFSFVNHQTGVSETIEAVNVTVSYPDMTAPFKLSGAVTYKKKNVNFSVGVEKLMDVIAKKSSPVSVTVKTDVMGADLQGVFAPDTNQFDGGIDAQVSSLSGLLAWVGQKEVASVPFEKISFKSQAKASASKISLTQAELMLDEVKASGDVSLGLKGKPDIHARLTLGKLALDRFMSDAKAGEGQAGFAAEKSREWSADPIDFSALKSVNADLVLKTEGFSLKDAEVGPSTLTVKIDEGNMQAASSEATLFDGKFSSTVNLNAQSAAPTMAFKFNMDGVQAKPILTTFAGFKKLSGTAEANIAVTSSGQSQKAIVSNLAGNGNVVFRDGSLEGIDLVNIAKMIQNQLTDMGVGEGKTDFVALGGTFTIAQGVATNDDLSMKGPLVQATGKGQVDLPQKRVDYRVVPVLTASSAVEGASGIRVPVDIKGHFDNIKIKPDYGSLIQDAINNPDSIKGTLKGAKEQLKDAKGMIKDIKQDPAKALQSLFGGGIGADSAPTAPTADSAPTTPSADTAPVIPVPAEEAPAPDADTPASAPGADTPAPVTP